MKATCISVIALLLAASLRASPIVVGLVPDSDAQRMQELVRGAEWAAAALAPELALVVGRGPGHWGSLTAVIEELITVERATILIAPGDRNGAHLVAQIATRRHVPAIVTLPVGNAGQTGSFWLTTCPSDDHERDTLARQLGRVPLAGELAGWSAVRIAHSVLQGEPRTSSAIDITWRSHLPLRCRPTFNHSD